jgi:hypothetical protein
MKKIMFVKNKMSNKEFFDNQHKQILKDLEKLRDGSEKKEKEILRFKKASEEMMKKSLHNL